MEKDNFLKNRAKASSLDSGNESKGNSIVPALYVQESQDIEEEEKERAPSL